MIWTNTGSKSLDRALLHLPLPARSQPRVVHVSSLASGSASSLELSLTPGRSDGQQPHLLTIHFLRRVEIRAIRFYVDYNQDESYTPTHIVFHAGTGQHDLAQFAEMPLANPVGWQDVPLDDCGGGADGNSLCCWIVQMHVKENHQNGKDTHIRGIKIYGPDEYAVNGGISTAVREMETNIDEAANRLRRQALGDEEDGFQDLLDTLDQAEDAARYRPGAGGFSSIPDFMRDQELR